MTIFSIHGLTAPYSYFLIVKIGKRIKTNLLELELLQVLLQ